MKKIFVLLLTGIMVLLFNCIVIAGEYTYKSSGTYLNKLAHGSAYSWRIDLSKSDSDGNILDVNSQTITGTSLFFNNIRDWTDEKNVERVSLLDGSTGSGAQTHWDDQARSNYFYGQFNSKLLFRFKNMGTAPRDINVHLNNTEWNSYLPDGVYDGATMYMPENRLNKLISYASKVIFCNGFGQDCYLSNPFEKMTFCTKKTPGNAVPEPATFLLFGAGLLFFASKMRKKYTEV